MRMRPALAALFALALAGFSPATSALGAETPGPSKSLTPAQAEQVKKIIKEYLLQNPEVIIEAVEAYRDKQEQVVADGIKKAIAQNAKALKSDPEAPVLGNPKGDVTIVEFTDYNCPYCKSAYQTLMEAAKADPNVKIVIKEYPILAPSSITASKAALAANLQKKYQPLHDALMAHKGRLDDETVFKLAGDVGLDVARLKKDMENPAIEAQIKRVREQARMLNIQGTPAFVVGEQLAPGAVDLPTLKSLVAEARR